MEMIISLGNKIVPALTYLFEHLEGPSNVVSVLLAYYFFKEGRKYRFEDNKAKQLEIYLNLQEKWDDQWAHITALPEENKSLFPQDFAEVGDENTRVSIIQALNILSRAHHYFKYTKQEIEQSDWHETVKMITKKNLFVTAFNKTKYRYDKEFQSYMEKCIESHNVKTISVEKKTMWSIKKEEAN